jgi:uncharacterized protein
MKKFAIFFLVMLGITSSLWAVALPELKKRVNDTANVLSDQEEQELEDILKAQEDTSGNQIVILTINSLDGDTIEDFSNRVFKHWKLGDKKNNNGILIVRAVSDKKTRIEVGYGLEGAVPDVTAKQILETYMKPHFKQSAYFVGFKLGIAELVKATKGEYKAAEKAATKDALSTVLLFFCLLIAFILSVAFNEIHRICGGIVGALGFGLTMYLFSSSIPLIILLIIIGFCIGLISKEIVEVLGSASNSSSGGSSSGGSDYGSSSSSSYSGGGGDSGGGGGSSSD